MFLSYLQELIEPEESVRYFLFVCSPTLSLEASHLARRTGQEDDRSAFLALIELNL